MMWNRQLREKREKASNRDLLIFEAIDMCERLQRKKGNGSGGK